MNRKSRKALMPCFGTKEFSPKTRICKNCQHRKVCEKEQRTSYAPLDPPIHPKYHNVRKKYRGRGVTRE